MGILPTIHQRGPIMNTERIRLTPTELAPLIKPLNEAMTEFCIFTCNYGRGKVPAADFLASLNSIEKALDDLPDQVVFPDATGPGTDELRIGIRRAIDDIWGEVRRIRATTDNERESSWWPDRENRNALFEPMGVIWSNILLLNRT
jgi:hypothetical protein